MQHNQPNTGYNAQNAGINWQNPGYGENVGFNQQNPGYGQQNYGHPQQNFGYPQQFPMYNQPNYQGQTNTNAYQSAPQQFDVHFIRNDKSWKNIIDQANKWVNTNIHVKRVISISTTLCHTNAQGMITIFYDKSQNLSQLVGQYQNFNLCYQILDTTDSWDNQRKNVMVLIKHLCQNENRLISVNQLQVNQVHHERALTVIWYMKKL